ncbi:uncharacterized protein LOC122946920 [Acropora millepora]|uniref:uncharacterized protein LOC122946920 n=1 Tax=Acropora millepora TaxID=45264 RepID=UPI001CF3359C|nr:uncharacterized protein LOC122946920 [Acropora millepora]
MAHAEVHVPDTLWKEPGVLWFAIGMPTGTGKSTVYKYLVEIIKKVRQKLADEEVELKDWLLSDQTFEKMGEIMSQNDGKMLGLYDELTNWLSQVNLYSGAKGLLDTHEFTKLLELFSATSWSRQTVAGNANFKMPRTCLTLCGMTQPATAAPLIVDKNNVDKGLASRFLWIFPKPVFKTFSALEVSANKEQKEAAENFTSHLEDISIQIVKGSRDTSAEPNVYHLEITENRIYPTAYDLCQALLEEQCLQDPFICALFSKAKGQYLRLALPLHALLQVRPLPEVVPNTIPEPVQKASIHMIDLCIEHTALLAGRDIKEGKFLQPVMPSSSSLQSGDSVLQQIVLSYPGKYVSASKLNHLSKFRRDGGKQKVLMIFSALEHKQLGKIHQARNKVTFFIKPDSETLTEDEIPAFLASLQQLGITLECYSGAYNNVTHPSAVETTTQFNQVCVEHVQSPKRAKLDHTTSPSTSTDSS